MLYKLVDSNSFYSNDEKVARVVIPGHSINEGLVKAAAHSDIDNFVTSMLEPKSGKMYLHINAMGAGEYYGSNKNGDYFPEEQLIKHHKTFEEFGYVYRHHINKDPAKSIGKVIFAIYNHDMHRVELIAEVDRELGKDVLSRIEAGDFPFTSMACKTPYDVCSICANKAHTREEYCEHLSSQLNKLFPDGRKIMALNLAPLKFFDISIVIRPADITSSILRKVAYEGAEPCLGSADVAYAEGIDGRMEKEAETIKAAAIAKLADIVKQIDDGLVVDANPILEKVLDVPGSAAMDMMGPNSDFNQIINALAEAEISPGIGFLAQLIHQHHNPHSLEDISHQVEALVPTMSLDDIPAASMDLVPDVHNVPVSVAAKVYLTSRLMLPSSLNPEWAEKRAYYWERLSENQGPKPHYVEVPTPDRENTNQDYLLATIGAALVTKFILSALSKQKNQLKLVYGNPQVKMASQLHVVNVLLDSSATKELLRFKNRG